jgi:hypothetical protein
VGAVVTEVFQPTLGRRRSSGGYYEKKDICEQDILGLSSKQINLLKKFQQYLECTRYSVSYLKWIFSKEWGQEQGYYSRRLSNGMLCKAEKPLFSNVSG